MKDSERVVVKRYGLNPAGLYRYCLRFRIQRVAVRSDSFGYHIRARSEAFQLDLPVPVRRVQMVSAGQSFVVDEKIIVRGNNPELRVRQRPARRPVQLQDNQLSSGTVRQRYRLRIVRADFDSVRRGVQDITGNRRRLRDNVSVGFQAVKDNLAVTVGIVNAV